jgi:hypothetical protein
VGPAAAATPAGRALRISASIGSADLDNSMNQPGTSTDVNVLSIAKGLAPFNYQIETSNSLLI